MRKDRGINGQDRSGGRMEEVWGDIKWGHLRDIWRAGRGSKGLGNQGLGETVGGGKKNGGQWRVYNNL